MTNRIRVKSIDHVTIVVKDLAATRRFYVEALGMDEVPRPGFAFAGQWFQAGPTLIHTILEFEGSGKAGSAACANSRGHHFAFIVDDCNAAAQRIAELRIPFIDREVRAGRGLERRVLYVDVLEREFGGAWKRAGRAADGKVVCHDESLELWVG